MNTVLVTVTATLESVSPDALCVNEKRIMGVSKLLAGGYMLLEGIKSKGPETVIAVTARTILGINTEIPNDQTIVVKTTAIVNPRRKYFRIPKNIKN